jgi:hypothetical protein
LNIKKISIVISLGILCLSTGCTLHTHDERRNSTRYFILGFGTIKVTHHESMSAARLLSVGAVAKTNAQPMAALGIVSDNVVTMKDNTLGEISLESLNGRSFIKLSSISDAACFEPHTMIEL